MALEPSQGMVQQAKKKNVYKEFIMELVGEEPTSIKEGILKCYFYRNWQYAMFIRNFFPICLSDGEISWSLLHPAGRTLTSAWSVKGFE